MPSRARSQSHLETLTHTPEEGDTSSRPEAGSHPPPPLNVEPQVEVTTDTTIVAKRVRGPSRGKEVQGIVDRYGQLNAPIPPEFRAPIGDYASKLASKIGIEVRTRLPDPSVHRWKYVDASVKGAMFQRLNDQFDLEGDPIDIEKVMNTKFGRRLSNHNRKLHKQFRELKDAKGEEYARNHTPKDVGPTKWIDLIDKKWNTTKFLKQLKANIANRERMKTKHMCGFRSIPIRVENLAREKKILPDLAEFYKETHYNKETHEWILSEAQAHYENMIQR